MTNKELFKKTFSEIHVSDSVKERMIQIQEIKIKKKVNRKLVSTIACAILVFALCGFTYVSVQYWGVGIAGNAKYENLTQPFGTIASNNNTASNNQKNDLKKSDLIIDYDNIFVNTAVNYELESENIPTLYFNPAYMIIFTCSDEQGWNLENGDNITMNLILADQQSLELEIGYIINGKYYKLSSTKGSVFHESVIATENGEYYFCVINRSSANAIISSGIIN